MFSEIRRSERITDRLAREERERKEREMCENGYLRIKPKTKMTMEEANAFWMSRFAGTED